MELESGRIFAGLAITLIELWGYPGTANCSLWILMTASEFAAK